MILPSSLNNATLAGSGELVVLEGALPDGITASAEILLIDDTPISATASIGGALIGGSELTGNITASEFVIICT